MVELASEEREEVTILKEYTRASIGEIFKRRDEIDGYWDRMNELTTKIQGAFDDDDHCTLEESRQNFALLEQEFLDARSEYEKFLSDFETTIFNTTSESVSSMTAISENFDDWFEDIRLAERDHFTGSYWCIVNFNSSTLSFIKEVKWRLENTWTLWKGIPLSPRLKKKNLAKLIDELDTKAEEHRIFRDIDEEAWILRTTEPNCAPLREDDHYRGLKAEVMGDFERYASDIKSLRGEISEILENYTAMFEVARHC